MNNKEFKEKKLKEIKEMGDTRADYLAAILITLEEILEETKKKNG